MTRTRTKAALLITVAAILAVGLAHLDARAQSRAAVPARDLSFERAVSGNVSVTSLALEGRIVWRPVYEQVPSLAKQGEGIELLFLPPDYYRRTRSDANSLWFEGVSAGTSLIGVKVLDPSLGSASSTEDPATHIPKERAIAARLWLGMLGATGGVLHLKATPTPKTGVVRVTGDAGFECQVDLDAATGVPLRVRYSYSALFAATPDPAQPQRKRVSEPAEITIAFSDRRAVGGVRIPHRILQTAHSTSSGKDAKIEEMQFEKVSINTKLTPADFRLPK